jgi:spore maturation protein CgeB
LRSLKDARKRLRFLKNRLLPNPSDEEFVHERLRVRNSGCAKPAVLYAGLGSDYGRPGLGLGYDTVHFYYSLVHGGYPVMHFPYDAVRAELGKERMQSVLRLACLFFRPAVLFHVIMDDEFDAGTIRGISTELGIPTVAFFSDDHWRFDSFSRSAAKPYDRICTTSADAAVRYRQAGFANVIRSQWGANHFVFRPLACPYEHDVSFVGQPHGCRRAVIERLKERGIPVSLWGRGWDNGRIDMNGMIRLFSASRINLNLSNASVGADGRAGGAVPLLQIKGRDFEIPACGGFLLTQDNPELYEYFEPGKEIAVYSDADDLAEKIEYYLSHDAERNRIRLAGYERFLRDHTMLARLEAIFDAVLSGRAPRESSGRGGSDAPKAGRSLPVVERPFS